MKRCPTCNRTFTDESLSFCIEDGTPLVESPVPPPDPETTIVAPSSRSSPRDAGATESVKGAPENDWKEPAYQPPGQLAPRPGVAKRRVWPWVVGILALLLIAVAGIGLAAAIVIPNMLRAAENENNSNFNANSGKNANANQDSNVNTNTNANSLVVDENTNGNANARTNANANANTGLSDEAPTNTDEVLSDLTDLEKQWTEANLSADKKTLARILADDYVGTQPDGSIQGKAEYLRDIKPDKSIKDWELQDLKLALKGDRATLKGRMRLEREGEDQEQVLQFTDKFVWRDERWQAVASEVSPANK